MNALLVRFFATALALAGNGAGVPQSPESQLSGPAGSGRVIVVAAGELAKPAQWLSVRFEMFASGRDSANASQRFDALAGRARASLTKLGADPQSIKLGSQTHPNHLLQAPTLAPPLAGLDESGGSEKKARRGANGAQQQQVQLISATISARFPLSTSADEAGPSKQRDVEKVIGSEGLNGVKALPPAACSHCSGMLGQPFFRYMAKIDRDDKLQAMKQAVAAARSEAEDLAAAANGSLGGILEISRPEKVLSGPAPLPALPSLPAPLPPLPSLSRLPIPGQLAAGDVEDKSFASGDSAGSISYSESVRVVYRLVPNVSAD